ncbi:ABC transporter substrate-binding protein [Microvirga antarctica]|uniref:ABC transporter substrate-binding protein n=1 Tax=Microvirga antarctica TaxID=2819233 RepID=UPI001FE7DA42|nr:ABC transporter substrate-binding protein [Microvirga antarctica]
MRESKQLSPLLGALATGLLLTLAAISAATAQERPARVVSLNLCADQLLLRLADPAQIASLSPLSRDASLSYLADGATRFTANDGRGESILFSGADLVLTGSFGQQTRTALLRRRGFDVQALEPWRSLAHGREQIRLVAGRLGHPERGETLIGEIDAALADAAHAVPAGRRILTYYRRGWVPASDSLVSEILTHLGFSPHQESLGLERGGIVRLETLVMTPPDALLLDDESGRAIDNGSALLTHPALAAAVPSTRRLSVDSRLSICGGPSTPALIQSLAAQARSSLR